MSKCTKCGATLVIGSYPFCKGSRADHDTVRSKHAQRFQPTYYARNPKTGEIRFLAHKNARLPKGFNKEAITTLHEADKFMREVNASENSKAQEAAYHESRFWKGAHGEGARNLEILARGGQTQIPDQDEHGNPYLRTVDGSHFSRQGKEQMQRLAEQLRSYQGPKPKDANFYIEPFAFDASNRESWASPETDWKERKE